LVLEEVRKPSNIGHFHRFSSCEDSRKGARLASLKFRGNVPREYGPQTSLISVLCSYLDSLCSSILCVKNLTEDGNLRQISQHALYASRDLPRNQPLLLIQAALFQAASCLHSSHRRGKLPSQALFFSHAIILFSRSSIIANRSLIHGSVMVSTVSSTTASLQIESQPKLERREFELERHLMGGCEQMGRLGAGTCQRKLGGINRH